MSIFYLYHFVTALIVLGFVAEATNLAIQEGEEPVSKSKLIGTCLLLMLISPGLVPVTIGAWFANRILNDDETSNN
jgi:hypothetical protein